MITTTGKELIAKFLLGQAPAYATHISIGCGARPAVGSIKQVTYKSALDRVATITSANHGYRINDVVVVDINDETYDGIFKLSDVTANTFSYGIVSNATLNANASGVVYLYSADKASMDFEVARIPVSSKGYVNEDGTTKIAFAAELPTAQRYLISEVGLWSAGSNDNAVSIDSKHLFSFAQAENWKYHHGDTIEEVPFRTVLGPSDLMISIPETVFIIPSDTRAMTSSIRANRFEPGRYLSNVIMMRGDSSKLLSPDPKGRDGIISLDTMYTNEHIHLDVRSMDFSLNNPADKLRLAFSVVSKEESNNNPPEKTRVYIELLHSESDASTGYARMYGEIRAADLNQNRYTVLSKSLSDLSMSQDFSWQKVRLARIFVSCYDDLGDLSDDYYVSLDGFRFDNISSPNPLYAMTAYSVVSDGYEGSPKPIYKVSNTANYIEFRETLQVL